MNERRHYVFDTNTLVSALLFEGSKPAQALWYALRHGEVLLSPSTLGELAEVLQREKFERYVTAAERDEFLAALVARARFLEPTQSLRACRDPNDNKFLELAVEGNAGIIISGDSDLLVLHPFQGIAIMRAGEFLHAMNGDVGS